MMKEEQLKTRIQILQDAIEIQSHQQAESGLGEVVEAKKKGVFMF
jgi:hypothetical protein